MKYRPAGNSIFFCLSWFSREQEEILQLFRKRLHGKFALVTTLDTNQKFHVDTFRIKMSKGGFVSANVSQHHTYIYCRLDLRVRSNTSVSVFAKIEDFETATVVTPTKLDFSARLSAATKMLQEATTPRKVL